QSFDQMLDKFRIPPFPQLFTRSHSEVRSHLKQLSHRVARSLPFAELPVRRGEREMRAPEAGHVDLEGDVQRTAVVALAVSIEEECKHIPAGMVRIEPYGPFRQSVAPLPIAGISNLKTQIGSRKPVNGIKRNGVFGVAREAVDLSLEELSRSQSKVSKMVRWCNLDGT